MLLTSACWLRVMRVPSCGTCPADRCPLTSSKILAGATSREPPRDNGLPARLRRRPIESEDGAAARARTLLEFAKASGDCLVQAIGGLPCAHTVVDNSLSPAATTKPSTRHSFSAHGSGAGARALDPAGDRPGLWARPNTLGVAGFPSGEGVQGGGRTTPTSDGRAPSYVKPSTRELSGKP